jgi:hypothetical protein
MGNSCTLGLNQSWPVTRVDLVIQAWFWFDFRIKIEFFLELDGIET